MSKARVLIALCALVAACEFSTDLVAVDRFSASMNGASVLPTPVQSSASGSLTITLTSAASDSLSYDLTFQGLLAPATTAHIHGPAADTATAEIIVDLKSVAAGGQGTFQGGTSGSASGWFSIAGNVTQTMTGDSLFKLLHAGLLYADVHSTSPADAEIRGQIRKR